MIQKKNENSKKIIQIPLLNIVRIKKTNVSAEGIKKIKLHFYKMGVKILGVIIKPTKKEEESRL